MIINLSKIKTEALLLLCKDIITSYENIEDEKFEIDDEINIYIKDTSKDILKELKRVTKENDYYLNNKNSYTISAILQAYNFLNLELSKELKEGVSFNPSMLYISLLSMWFNELGKESKSKEYIYFLLYPYSITYDKLLLNIKDEKFKVLNIKMIDIAEQVILKYNKYTLK
jgi:hypothetical protein|tara:strand:+ start:452 stop:964 length:513 start_codon:yes stop_codon:yes gene_type:complete